MKIQNLSNTSHEELVDCLVKAFANYFVKMPADLDFWRKRFLVSRVDLSNSFGVFDGTKLVAFIITGMDTHEGALTAFNAGTGVLPDYRGQHLVSKIYDKAIPIFKAQGVQKCMLEVIQENEKAIKVYERVGFKITRKLASYKAKIDLDEAKVTLGDLDFQSIVAEGYDSHKFYSWDFQNGGILKSLEDFESHEVFYPNQQKKAYFTINKQRKILAQLEAEENHLMELFAGIQQVIKEFSIVNVDTRRTALLQTFDKLGFENFINQYEMEMPI